MDLTFDSLSNTAIDVIHEMTKVINAITVILLITAAQPLNRKQRSPMTITAIRYLSQPPRSVSTGMSRAAHIIPSRRHLSIMIIKAFIDFNLSPDIMLVAKYAGRYSPYKNFLENMLYEQKNHNIIRSLLK